MDLSWLSVNEKIETCRSLSCLSHCLPKSRCTTIQLKNELTVIGLISHVDRKMNLTVSSAVILNIDGHSIHQSCAQVFILASQVRSIHISDNLDIMQSLTNFCDLLTKKTEFKRRKLWKSRRDKHLETKAIAKAYRLGRGRAEHVK